MHREREDAMEKSSDQLVRGMTKFTNLPEGVVSHFILEGHTYDTPTKIEAAVMLYPEGFASGIESEEKARYYEKILSLQIPDVRKKPQLTDERVARAHALALRLENMPVAMLGFGYAEETQEERVILFVIAGVEPQEVLREIQQAVRERI